MPSTTCKVTEVQFLMLVINSMGGSAINFHHVAEGAGMTSGAASMKYWRLKKSHPLPSDDTTSMPSPMGKAKTTPRGESKIKGSCATATSSKKRKLDEVYDAPEAMIKAEADGEDD